MAKTITPEAQAIAAAELAVTAKLGELAAAEAAVRLLQFELNEARETLHDARVAADNLLPQCRMVHVAWRSGKESDGSQVAILKKTPGGTLVVRPVGSDSGEMRFKWSPYREKFVQAEKSQFIGSRTRELRDVPAEFLPIHSQDTQAERARCKTCDGAGGWEKEFSSTRGGWVRCHACNGQAEQKGGAA